MTTASQTPPHALLPPVSRHDRSVGPTVRRSEAESINRVPIDLPTPQQHCKVCDRMVMAIATRESRDSGHGTTNDSRFPSHACSSESPRSGFTFAPARRHFGHTLAEDQGRLAVAVVNGLLAPVGLGHRTAVG